MLFHLISEFVAIAAYVHITIPFCIRFCCHGKGIILVIYTKSELAEHDVPQKSFYIFLAHFLHYRSNLSVDHTWLWKKGAHNLWFEKVSTAEKQCSAAKFLTSF